MPLTQFPALQKLPKREKLKLADALWCAAIDDSAPVSAEHRALLDSRWKAYRAGTAKRIPLAELERRLLRTRRTCPPEDLISTNDRDPRPKALLSPPVF